LLFHDRGVYVPPQTAHSFGEMAMGFPPNDEIRVSQSRRRDVSAEREERVVRGANDAGSITQSHGGHRGSVRREHTRNPAALDATHLVVERLHEIADPHALDRAAIDESARREALIHNDEIGRRLRPVPERVDAGHLHWSRGPAASVARHQDADLLFAKTSPNEFSVCLLDEFAPMCNHERGLPPNDGGGHDGGEEQGLAATGGGDDDDAPLPGGDAHLELTNGVLLIETKLHAGLLTAAR
jgi:hypothetical protein